MKFLHLSDLHLGRRLFDVSLLEDQQFLLEQILAQLDDQGADAVLLAGDLYDKPVPSAEAVTLLDWFLTQLAERDLPVLLVSGNHDSPERLAFGSKLLDSRKIYVESLFRGTAAPVVLEDEFGLVYFYLLPFIKPIHVRRLWEEDAETYTEAVEAVISRWDPDPACRNVFVGHQLVTGGERSDSEALSIGGLDDVAASVFEAFDYAALGHLHRAQTVGEKIRYCGSPLAYSFSEGDQEKTLTWVELGEKGDVRVTTTAIKPLRPLRTLRGEFEALLLDSAQDYLRIVLVDEEDVPNAISRLLAVYPNLLKVEYDNLRTRMEQKLDREAGETLSPMELLEKFYALRNNQPMSLEQKAFAQAMMEQIWEDET